MNSQKAKQNQIEIAVIGCGIAGITTAYVLRKKGYKVSLLDPKVNSEISNSNPSNGSQAALGVLMGNINKKTKGRAFFQRKQSKKLWEKWLIEINKSDSKIKIEKPLIKLASSEKEYQSMIDISINKNEKKIELLSKESIDLWSSIMEHKLIGGLISYEDGRLNPIKLLKSFMKILNKMKVNMVQENVIRIEKNINLMNKRWKIYFESDQYIYQDYIIICSALNTQKLLTPLGHTICLEPVLGQVIELELENPTSDWNTWPAILNYQNINIIHQKNNQILIGATLEKNTKPSFLCKQEMLDMNNSAPSWIRNAKVINEWSGVRARPLDEPAPLLKVLEPGLLINTGHYRNGILLAPYCAEWIGLKID